MVRKKLLGFSRLKQQLKKTAERFGLGFNETDENRIVDDSWLEELEDSLIQSDLGVDASLKIVAEVGRMRLGKKMTSVELRQDIAAQIEDILKPIAIPLALSSAKPHVVLMVGVNGSGKTTSIGKLAYHLTKAGKKVMIAAGDTFRAAAVSQLQIWGERANVPVFTLHSGADPASLALDSLKAAQAEKTDVLLIDTAGRLQNRQDLMEELKKIKRVLQKIDPLAPHSVILVIDATTGQNVMGQVEVFNEIAQLTGLIVTKLDGSAKAGVMVGVADRFNLPIHAIGIGEKIEDLAPFSPKEFSHVLLGLDHL